MRAPSFIERVHWWVWIRICYVNAHLAFERDARIEAYEWLNQMREYEDKLNVSRNLLRH